MSEQRWTQETAELAERAYCSISILRPRPDEIVTAILAALADAGLLVTPSTPDGPPEGGGTLGWEVLTRQQDGTWVADWDASTHATRESAEREATKAASLEHFGSHGVSYPARVARLVADGPIHEPDASGEVHSGQ